MWIILGLMLAGSLAGLLISRRIAINPFTERITSLVIYFLLFFMGLRVGTDREIMAGLHHLGPQALIITFFTVSGSILLAKLVGYLFFRDENEEGKSGDQ